MSRKAITIVVAVVVVIVVAILVVPSFIDANRYKPQIEAAMSQSLGRKVQIGDLHVSLFSGGINVNQLSIGDDPAFASAPFLTAQSVSIHVKWMPLIFSHALQVTGLTIERPQVSLIRSRAGMWNFATLGATGTPASAPQPTSTPKPASTKKDSPGNPPASPVAISVDRLAITNGTLSVANAGSSAKPRVYTDVALQASNLSYTTQFPFQFSAKAPGNGSIQVNGNAGPLNAQDAQATPLQANIQVKGLNLRSTGFVDPASGIAGVVDFAGTLNSDGRELRANGKMNASRLQLAPGGSPATVPVEVDYQTAYELKPETGTLNRGDVHIGKALAHLSGAYNNSGDNIAVQMKLTGQQMPASDLEAVLPALGVSLPSGASLQQGALDADLTISGPVDRLVTTGPITLSNAKLAGFDLGSKLGPLSALAGKLPNGRDTLIQLLSSQVRVAPEGIRADDLKLIVPSIGSLTGNGTISSQHDLDFHMIAHLGGSAGAISDITKLAGIGGGNRNSGGLPFRIQGTTAKPVFVPDLAGLAGGFTKRGGNSGSSGTSSPAQTLGNALGGLFGKKKTQ